MRTDSQTKPLGKYELQIFVDPTGLIRKFPYFELDPTEPVPVGLVVYISKNSPIATVGLMDLVQGVVVIAKPGIWVSIQDVPAQTVVDGVAYYNVPQPVTSVAVTGSPLKVDFDVATVFWGRIE